MLNNDSRDDLDDLIDLALPGYSGPGPVHGLEERVLHRVRAAQPAWRSTWPSRLRFAVPVLAALFLAVMLVRTSWWKPLSHTSVVMQAPAAPNLGTIQPVSASERREVPAPASRVAKVKPRPGDRRKDQAHPGALPKGERFPSPVPMTPEERVLVAWAAQAPEKAREAFQSLAERSDQPILIEPIQIPPLPGDGAQ